MPRFRTSRTPRPPIASPAATAHSRESASSTFSAFARLSSRLATLTAGPITVGCAARPADAAYDQAAAVEAHREPQRLGDLVDELLIDVREFAIDRDDGLHRRPRGAFEAVGMLEHRHHAVADIFVDAAARRLDRAPDAGEEAVEDIDDVIGELGLTEPREAADVDEEHGRDAIDAS